MNQVFEASEFWNFLVENYWHIEVIAWGLIGLAGFFSVSYLLCIFAGVKKLIECCKIAPSVMTAAGLLGTFIGLSLALKNLNLDPNNVQSLHSLLEGLKAVFVYSFVGVAAAIVFMFFNAVLSGLELKRKQIQRDAKNKQVYVERSKRLDAIAEEQEKYQFESLNSLNKLLVEQQKQPGILAQNIVEGVRVALNPLLASLQKQSDEQREATSQNLSEAVAQINKSLKVMVAMYKQQEQVNSTLAGFNIELKRNLDLIQPAIEKGLENASQSLTLAITTASTNMENNLSNAANVMVKQINSVSQNMNGLVDKVGSVVGSMSTIQQKQDNTLTTFNQKLQTNLQSIQPAIEKGLENASESLQQAISGASTEMVKHVGEMSKELERTGMNAQVLLDKAAINLSSTLGNVHTTIESTADVLKDTLESFRTEYQERLTEYLDKQQVHLNGFLERQNQQLETTIGQQRQGLVDVAETLRQNFEHMTHEQKNLNRVQNGLLTQISATEQAVLPKLQSIAQDLFVGDKKLSLKLNHMAEILKDTTTTLNQINQELPQEFERAFEHLHQQYAETFNNLDSGLKAAVNNLSGATGALAAAIPLHDAMAIA